MRLRKARLRLVRPRWSVKERTLVFCLLLALPLILGVLFDIAASDVVAVLSEWPRSH